MLVPFSLYLPVELLDLVPVTLDLEQQLPASAVLFPQLRITNSSESQNMEVKLDETEDLGLSNDPLFTGQLTTPVFDQTLTPLQTLWHVLRPFIAVPNIAIVTTKPPVLTNKLTFTSKAGLDSDGQVIPIVVRVSIYGFTEQSIKQTQPAPITI